MFNKENLETDLDCSICYNIMVEPTKLICGHHFCIQCAKMVLNQSTVVCPMCRTSLPKTYLGFESVDKEL